MQTHHLLHRNIDAKGMPSGATAHPIGAVRLGTEPASSALDVNWKAHQIHPDPR